MKIKGDKVIIRAKKSDDAVNDYRWQSDKELSALDAVSPLNLPFQDYYREYIETLVHPYPNRITFAVDTHDGIHIGNCVYYNIDKESNETEIGIMIGERYYWDQGYGTEIISTLIDYLFIRLKFQRIYLKTLITNIRAQKCFEKCGLVPCGYRHLDGYHFLVMDISRSRWQELKNNSK
jgi:RimJ/RimL family protein N-acetyltransferase